MPSVFESHTTYRWKVESCSNETSSMECYFEPLTSCSLSLQDIVDAPVSESGYGIHVYPLRDARIVRLIGLPGYGPWYVTFHLTSGRRSPAITFLMISLISSIALFVVIHGPMMYDFLMGCL